MIDIPLYKPVFREAFIPTATSTVSTGFHEVVGFAPTITTHAIKFANGLSSKAPSPVSVVSDGWALPIGTAPQKLEMYTYHHAIPGVPTLKLSDVTGFVVTATADVAALMYINVYFQSDEPALGVTRALPALGARVEALGRAPGNGTTVLGHRHSSARKMQYLQHRFVPVSSTGDAQAGPDTTYPEIADVATSYTSSTELTYVFDFAMALAAERAALFAEGGDADVVGANPVVSAVTVGSFSRAQPTGTIVVSDVRMDTPVANASVTIRYNGTGAGGGSGDPYLVTMC